MEFAKQAAVTGQGQACPHVLGPEMPELLEDACMGLLQRLQPPCPQDMAAKIKKYKDRKIEQTEHFKMGQEASRLLRYTEENSAACLSVTSV